MTIILKRESEMREKVRGREREFSVFVFNLPRLLDKYGLQGIFQKAGRICDTYIPTFSGRNGNGTYGFVRFRKVEDARRSIQLFPGALIRGNRLHVTKAKPKKRTKQGSQGLKGAQWNEDLGLSKRRVEWRQKVNGTAQRRTSVTFSSEGQSFGLSLIGEISEDKEEWLHRSLVCSVEEPRDLASLSSALMSGYDQDVKLSALSSFKFLLTFPTEERMEDALNHQDELHHWFFEVKRWGVEEFCDSRKVWLAIVGVPPHGWSWENFKKIAELWGRFVCLGKSTAATDSFEVMRVLIATKIFQKINSELLFTLGSCGFRVTITEAEMVTPASPKFSKVDDPQVKEVIPGFEDIEDIDESEDDNIGVGVHGHEGEEFSENQGFSNSNSNMKKVQEPPKSNDNRQVIPSRTRTKTVSFSHNGYSEEICKVRQHLRNMGMDEINDESIQVSQPPPGFEFEFQKHDSHSQGVDEASEVELVEESGAIVGSQNDGNLCRTLEQGRKVISGADVKFSFKEAPFHASSSSTSTESTSESLVKLAHESLKFGGLIGVRVTGDYEAAVSRITKPLKKIRGKGRRASKGRAE